ncbi:hypothetical protein NMG60_11034277 [Bertholletia excelsa]
MGHGLLLRSPKKEEQEVPDTTAPHHNGVVSEKVDIMEELEGILIIGNEENLSGRNKTGFGHLTWDFMDWEAGFSVEEEEEEPDRKVAQTSTYPQDPTHVFGSVKTENNYHGIWDGFDEKKASLNLSLNYQEVLDAWSGRGSLWADDCSLSLANNGHWMGEVPVMEEERTRREASVLRYKEKRQSRLFSKKIRYEVRKLNADKRPRLKGRFVKRGS